MLISNPYNFLFGFGSQRDFIISSDVLKIGSHSAYMGIFFKYGIFSLLSFISFKFFIFYKTLASFLKDQITINELYILIYFQIIFIFLPVFYEIDVDMIIIVFIFSIYGFIFSFVNNSNEKFN